MIEENMDRGETKNMDAKDLYEDILLMEISG